MAFAKFPQVQVPENEPQTLRNEGKDGMKKKNAAAVVTAHGNSLILLLSPLTQTHKHAGRIASVWHRQLNASHIKSC